MKKILFLLALSFIFHLNSYSQDLKKLEDSEVDKSMLQVAENFALDYLTKLKEGSYYDFQDEATVEFKKQMTEKNQKMKYQQLKENFGDFNSLDYEETYLQNKNSPLQIFRFKSEFEDSNQPLEVRVVLNEAGKIAGFWIKPWRDNLQ